MTSDGQERPAAAADLLQMWVGGATAPAPEQSDDAPEASADDTTDTTDTSGTTEQDVSAPADEAPATDLWPAGTETADDEGAEEWWPYDEQAAATAPAEPAPVETPAAEAPSEEPATDSEALWDDSVESEWAEPAAEEPAPVETAAAQAPAEEPQERGWASFGAAQTAEDVLDQLGKEDGWSQAPPAAAAATEPETEPESAAAEPEPAAEEAVVEPTPLRPRQGLDLSATTHWSLDDFESYIRAQGSNELAGWMSGSTAQPEPEPEPEPAPEPEPEPEPAAAAAPEPEVEAPEEPAAVAEPEPPGEQTVAWTPVEAEAPVETPVAAAPDHAPEAEVDQPAHPDDAEPADEPAPRKRGLLAKMGLTREQEPEQATDEAVTTEQPAEGWTEPDVEWDPYAADAQAPGAAAPGAEQPLFEVPEPEPTAASPAVEQPAEEPSAPAASDTGAGTGTGTDWDPDATQYFDWTLDDVAGATQTGGAPGVVGGEAPAAGPEDVPLPSGGPVGAESVVPGLTTPEEAPTAAEPQPAEQAAEQLAEQSDDQDYQEWYDDQGLRWVSTDGGYTWFSDDGQGWNAEVGEPIDVPADAVPPAAPDVSATAAAPDDTVVAPAVSDDSWPSQPVTQPEEDVWPAAADDTPTTTAEGWPEPEQPADPTEADPYAALYAPPAASTPITEAPVAAAAPATTSPATVGTTAAPATGTPEIPPFVEYKPRGAYRPILGVLFVAAAILAVVAIFWAVSKGSQAATGIAAGVTGFALAFWWGLLSWTPTVVSLSGSVLEVARGSDGERFDLRSPKLVIDVDEDVDSRNWRTTITRPNGTELVIPASAVDPEEFSRIVRHYRAEATAG